MADQAVDDDVFVYTGGRAPQHVINVIIDKSVKVVGNSAFINNPNLRSVEFHDGVERIGRQAFGNCPLLRRIKLPGVKLIEEGAFYGCRGLEDVEFGDKMETIGEEAFSRCRRLQSVKIPSIRYIGDGAFSVCTALTDAEFGEGLEGIDINAFGNCIELRRIAIPPRYNLIFNVVYQSYNQFEFCPSLTTVDLVGGIHRTIASLLLERWRNAMNEEINRINTVLPNLHPREKTDTMRQWIRSVVIRIEHYKEEHHRLLKEATTLLELALWKAKLDEEDEGGSLDEVKTKKVKIDVEGARKEARITSGASIVIKNVLPFLELA